MMANLAGARSWATSPGVFWLAYFPNSGGNQRLQGGGATLPPCQDLLGAERKDSVQVVSGGMGSAGLGVSQEWLLGRGR